MAEVMFKVRADTLEVRATRLTFIEETFLVRLSRVPFRADMFACREVLSPVS